MSRDTAMLIASIPLLTAVYVLLMLDGDGDVLWLSVAVLAIGYAVGLVEGEDK